MTFDEHIRSIWKKASAKLNKLNRAATFMCPDKRHLIMNIFFSAQFNYYSLIWMFDNRILNQKINRFYERYSVSLRIQSECGKIRTRKNSVFRHFLHSDISLLSIIIITHAIKNSNSFFSIHHMNLQFLANSFEPRIIIQFKEPTKICYKGCTYITLWFKLVKLSRTKNMGNGSK